MTRSTFHGTLCCALLGVAATSTLRAQGVDWPAVDAAVGRASVTQPGDVHRFNFSRTDLTVITAGVTIRPTLALGGWIAIQAAAGGVMAMGDLVVTEDEFAPAMIALQRGGIEQSAIHRHLLHEWPRILYIHVHAHGDPVAIATVIHAAIAVMKIPAVRSSPALATPLDLDTAAVARALGYSGRATGGVYQVGVPRSERILEGTVELPPSMGLNTVIDFQPTSGGRASITGDFVLLPSEVNPVIRSLQSGGLEVTALHSHILDEMPRLMFMHFWANADAVQLANTLRATLALTKLRLPAP